MDTDEDYAWNLKLQEDFINDLHDEFARELLKGHDDLYGQVIEQFAVERLQSYYVDNPKLAEPCLWALDQAHSLKGSHPDGALLFAVIATEVGMKTMLLKPILHGIVHADSMAALIVDLIPEQRNDKFKKILFKVLHEFGGIDLSTFKRDGQGQTLWEEIRALQTLRNGLVHRAQQISMPDAEHGIEIAALILETIIPSVIAKLGLHTKGRLEICR